MVRLSVMGTMSRRIVAQLVSLLARAGGTEERIPSQTNVLEIIAHQIKYKSEAIQTEVVLTACKQH